MKSTETGCKALKRVETWRLDRELNCLLFAHQSDVEVCDGFRAPTGEVTGLLRYVYGDCMSLMP